MKYELETIPVWDAFQENGECPFCLLSQKAEEGYLKFFLGNSVMVPEMRVEVNNTGYCAHHYDQLLDQGNRHGLGLMLHTRYQTLNQKKAKQLKNLINHYKITSVQSLLKAKKNKTAQSMAEFLTFLEKEQNQCMICQRIDNTMSRYYYTSLILWKKDDQGFRKVYRHSKGMCTSHFIALMRMAPKVLSGRNLSQFYLDSLQCLSENSERLEGEILWYTQKFDPQYKDKPWGTAKDAVYRIIQNLTGLFRREE